MASEIVDKPAEAEETIRPGAFSWTEELRRVSNAVSKTTIRVAAGRSQLFYLLHWNFEATAFGISVVKGRDPENSEEWWDFDRAFGKLPPFVGEEDAVILRLIWESRGHANGLRAFALEPATGGEILRRASLTGRLCPAGDRSPLAWAEPRPGTLRWCPDGHGCCVATLAAVPEAALVIPLASPWYVDLDDGLIGELTVDVAPERLTQLLALPPVPVSEAARLSDVLALPDAEAQLSALQAGGSLRRVEAAPVAVLRLQTVPVAGHLAWRDYPELRNGGMFDAAFPSFRYQDVELRPDEARDFLRLPDGETVALVRRREREQALMTALLACGLEQVPAAVLFAYGSPPDNAFALARETDWDAFMQTAVPQLRESGWQVEFDDDFRHHALEVEAWDAQLIESDSGWFDLDMGIVVEGERLPLAPLLASLFRRDARWLDSLALHRIDDAEMIDLLTPANRRIRAPAARIKPLAATLMDLFEGLSGATTLRVSRFDTTRLRELSDTNRWQFRGQNDVLALAERLVAAQGVGEIVPPAGLGLELRGYQREGVAWLQFLREHDLSGILADDMGLGKTAQALAHLLIEKEAGRLDRPALVVLPTSLIFNWRNEAARFAPGLSILSLHGAERKARFDEIPNHDVVLTTYPLLWRDAADLKRHSYHLLILDEAQTVKNARSQGADVVRKIDARHRLCLTGTPLENHLGELWSQFDFLLPGFLGTNANFMRYWRVPIEKQGDHERRSLLARRVRPFVLRRRKEEVARELPEKTVIVRKVELSGGQRDLYEAVRVAMDAMVREEVVSKGFGRSQIVILDALLKLRQVCCDPRLVRTPLAQRVKERAKLDLLMTMLPEQVEEGRRILLFSQFARMLALIEGELKRVGLDYVMLTGDTVDRETPVQRFQAGEVPIFLISLKAGGVGLNLTAADTVIHFDPWWNPAVENQATDRAHRIGQDKPVFVYKLIVAGSIEERILTLQERKAELADGILSDDRGVELKFGEEDIAALFSPLPD
ncbi:DEAD/DEAH box helicase [uncultured Propionivibrio sp.]|uniref:DEAD/DEAH box helicase n=1 Tax=uncultured Propionivibrio sp. TaxID=426737 RepID=UPI0029BFFE88|nr:DEAD/DEAH box helicase [uncultured Propionivibrio sp.]